MPGQNNPAVPTADQGPVLYPEPPIFSLVVFY